MSIILKIGGATNKGITHKTYAEFLGRPLEDVDELKNIPEEHVQEIYKKIIGTVSWRMSLTQG